LIIASLLAERHTVHVQKKRCYEACTDAQWTGDHGEKIHG
jgi:hypothetical protein